MSAVGIAHANTVTVPATDSDGNYTVSWSMTSGFVALQETTGGPWTTITLGQTTGSFAVTGRSPGTYGYRAEACTTTFDPWGDDETTCEYSNTGIVVVSANTAPTISNIANQTTIAGQSTGNINFTVNDAETSGSSLIVTKSSNNTSLVPTSGISVSTSGNNRTVSVTPSGSQTGTATITLTVSDGSLTDSDSFIVTVTAGSTATNPLIPPSPYVQSPPGEDTASTRVGVLGGQFRVDESGAATYSVPLKLPSAPGNIQPPVSLSYSSNGGNGVMGMGWNISGLSGISRCRRTKETHDGNYPVTLTADDRFCLDGQPLVLISDTYGSVGAQYITELYSGSRVTSVGGALGNPSTFKVEKEDGSIWHYGQDASSKLVTITGKNVSWLLTKIEDNVGNAIDYNYRKHASMGYGENEFLIDSIVYGGNEIDFIYNAEGLRGDTLEGYAHGVMVQRKAILSDIVVKNHAQVSLVSYHMEYDEGIFASGSYNSHLTSIQQCDGSRSGVCTLADSFDWSTPGIVSLLAGDSTLDLANSTDVIAAIPVDYNTDGFADWIYASKFNNSNYYRLQFHTNNADATGLSFITAGTYNYVYKGSLPYEDVQVVPIDYDGDGDIEVMAPKLVSGVLKWHVFYTNNATATNTGVTYKKSHLLSDANGDGLVDIVTFNTLYLNNGSGFTTTTIGMGDLEPGEPIQLGKITSKSGIDINGDGSTEIYVEYQVELTPDILTTRKTLASIIENSTGFEYKKIFANRSITSSALNVDINGDGLTDRIDKNSGQWQYQFSNGKHMTTFVNLNLPNINNTNVVNVHDANNDGNIEIGYFDDGSNRYRLYNYVGGTFTSMSLWSLPSGISAGNAAPGMADFDGDGRVDLYVVDYGSDKRIKFKRSRSVPLSDIEPTSKITAFTNGFGATTDVRYMLSIATDSASIGSMYTKYSGIPGCYHRCSPIFNIANPGFLVREVSSDSPAHNNTNNQVNIEYKYEGLRVQAGGRGSLGFGKLHTLDKQTNVTSTTHYRQNFPFIGMPLSTVTKYNNSTLNHSTQSHTRLNMRYLGGLENGRAYMPYPYEQYESSYLLNDSLTTSSKFTRTKTTTQYDPFPATGSGVNGPLYFAPSTITVETQDRNNAMVKSVTTTNTYTNEDEDNWHINRLTGSTVTHHLADNSKPDITRTSSFTYFSASDPEKGMLKTESVGSNVNDQLNKLHCYDSFGTRFVTITHSNHYNPGCNNYLSGKPNLNASAGQETHVYRINRMQYDGAGRHVTRTFNANDYQLSQTIAVNAWQQPQEVKFAISSTNQNGLVKRYRYDRFGNKYYEQDSTGKHVRTQSRLSANAGQIGAPSIAAPYAFVTKQSSSGGGVSFTYTDKIGRAVATVKKGFDGSWIYQYQRYDNDGRAYSSSVPSYSYSGAGWSTTSFDAIGRVNSVTDGNGTTTSQSKVLTPDGIRSTSAVVLADKTIEKHQFHDELGQLIIVDDNNNGSIQTGYGAVRYDYDATGNLLETIDVKNNITTIQYDTYGRKTQINDKSKGIVNYTYNALGELATQSTSANTKTLYRDLAGRLIKEHNSATTEVITHVYGDYVAKQSENITVGGVKRHEITYYYDQYNRMKRAKTYLATIGGAPSMTYVQQTTYDEHGRVFQLFDPDNDADLVGCFNDSGAVRGACKGVQNHYNTHGFLYKQTEARVGAGASGNDVFSEILSSDALGNVLTAKQGQRIHVTNAYDAVTGLAENNIVRSSTSGSSSGTVIQYNTYDFDEIGTLRERERLALNGTSVYEYQQSFTYDDMHRLTKVASADSGTSTDISMTYDTNGNILSKTSVGNYCYGSSNPYAVTGTGNCSSTYVYDNRGNMTSGRGRTINYSYFDKATKIEKTTAEYTEFYYGTSRARYLRKDVKDGVTTRTAYIGNLEIIRKSNTSVVQTRRAVPGGVINEYSNGISDLHFMHKDHLGSLNTMTNEAGQIVSKVAFDAWGKRTEIPKANWSGAAQTKAALSIFNLSDILSVTTRGYTGHEHIDNMDIIHMNGRIYDPTLGRFLQADPFVQAPDNSQSYNRYTYVLNSPLSYTDPSGFIFDKLMRPFKGLIRSVARVLGPTISTIASGFACMGNPICIGVLQYDIARAHGATSGSALKGAFTAAASAYAFQQIGGLSDISQTTRVLLHGTVGGISSVLQGGKFGHGFLSAGLTKAINVNDVFGPAAEDAGTRIIAAAVIGGTISKISGGKFGNGAITAAFAQMFNGENEAERDRIKAQYEADMKNKDVVKAIEIAESKLKDVYGQGYSEYEDTQIGIAIYENKNGEIIVGTTVNLSVPNGLDFGLKIKKFYIFGELAEVQGRMNPNAKEWRVVATLTTTHPNHGLSQMNDTRALNYYHRTAQKTGAVNLIHHYGTFKNTVLKSYGYGDYD